MQQKQKYLLLMEDNETDAFIIEVIMRQEPSWLDIVKFNNGLEGLDFLGNTDISENAPILILLDPNMPICDGFSLMESYDENLYAKFPSVPIYVLTSSLLPEDTERSLVYPFVKDFIVKPLDKQIVKSIIKSRIMSHYVTTLEMTFYANQGYPDLNQCANQIAYQAYCPKYNI